MMTITNPVAIGGASSPLGLRALGSPDGIFSMSEATTAYMPREAPDEDSGHRPAPDRGVRHRAAASRPPDRDAAGIKPLAVCLPPSELGVDEAQLNGTGTRYTGYTNDVPPS
jgi:hypothetical protein